jgi:hypothetical protein
VARDEARDDRHGGVVDEAVDRRGEAEARARERAVGEHVLPARAGKRGAERADAEADEAEREEAARPVAVDEHAAEQVAHRHGEERDGRAAREHAARPAEVALHRGHGDLKEVAVRE